MNLLKWLQRKSNWECKVKCKFQFRGKCYKTPPINIIPQNIGGAVIAVCEDIKQ